MLTMGLKAAWDALLGREKASTGGGAITGITRWGESPRRGTQELLLGYRTMPWLRAVAGRIASEFATACHWELYEGAGPTRRRLHEHRLLDVLANPSPRMPANVANQVLQISNDLVGDGFAIIDRNAFGEPLYLHPLAPHWVTRTPSDQDPNFQVSYNVLSRAIPARDMLWVRSPNPWNPYGRGAGIGEALADELDTDEAAAKWSKAFFSNMGVPEMLIGMKGADAGEVERAKSLWPSIFGGAGRSHQPLFTNREFNVQRLDTTFKDQQLTELRKHERDMIVQVFGVPPEIFGILDSSTRDSIDSAYYLFCKAVLVPRLDTYKAELQSKVVPAFQMPGQRLSLEYRNPVPDDRDFFIRSVATAPQAFRAGEVRARVGGLMPDPEIDNAILGSKAVVAGPTNLPAGKGGDPEWTRRPDLEVVPD